MFLLDFFLHHNDECGEDVVQVYYHTTLFLGGVFYDEWVKGLKENWSFPEAVSGLIWPAMPPVSVSGELTDSDSSPTHSEVQCSAVGSSLECGSKFGMV